MATWREEFFEVPLGSLDVDFDLSVTGFSTGELDVMLNGTADPEDEVIPEVPASPRTRLGDLDTW